MSSSNHDYDLLGVKPTASLDEIKQGYRRQMARYHPDKVQHLGEEFLELASRRAAQLTEAYQTLCKSRAAGGDAVAVASPPPPPASTDLSEAAIPTDENDFLSRAAVSTLREVVTAVLGDVTPRWLQGFDLALASAPKRRFFRQGEPALLVLGRVVSSVDPETVQAAWRDMARLGDDPDYCRCLFLMGTSLAPAEELAAVIAQQRRRPTRAGASVMLVPVNLQTWQSLVPTEAPAAVRSIIAELPAAR